MIIESCRLICDWLNDATNGVNALLPSTPLDGADAQPANLATISDMTRDGNVARGRLPVALPGLAISAQPVENLAPHITVADAEGDVHLVIRFGLTKTQTEQGFRDSSYYLRTVIRSLRRFNAADPTLRTRNSVYLEGASNLRMAQLWDALDDSVVTGAVLITFHCRDNVAT
jgi:hypothetical protein